jgi:ABC-type phosphate/phosphonate transport system substrate-binding protein
MSGEGAGRIASFAMYRDPPVVADATRTFWAHLRETLRSAGLPDVPEALDETLAHDAAWLDPRLLIAQTCGYPLMTRLREHVRVVATPVYDHPGCTGILGTSFVVVRADRPETAVAQLRGSTAAINDPASNSGMNVLRHLVAPHAVGGRFFGRVINSGGHLASIAMVTSGAADVAAIDCVTFGNLARFAPQAVAGVRVLTDTVKTPGLPLIARCVASDAELAALQQAVVAFVHDAAAAPVRETLGLRGFEFAPVTAYQTILDIEAEATAAGYPQIA